MSSNEISITFGEDNKRPKFDAIVTETELKTRIALEVRRYINEFSSSVNESEHELTKFWLRKSKKLVLSVLAVNVSNAPDVKFFRGMNVEVSLPAGSLCAERNAIGSAIASYPTLKRNDFLGIGTVLLDLSDILKGSPSGGDISSSSSGIGDGGISEKSFRSCETDGNPIWPCGVCSEWLTKITAKTDHSIIVLAFKDSSCEEYLVKTF